ncbi:hypothetical protein O0L34_g14823 [Tuta absoluta]|nr:hypothetical protein O0L34_g14823 [Tuta absoluta]
MGRKVLLVAICWLMISQALGEQKNKKTISVTIDNESAESGAPRLYRNGPLTVYASAVPYTPYALKGHSVLAAGSQQIPVKAGSNHGLVNLKDSYGKYVETHQSAYTPSYPQQFVPLQDLPPHLAQPLVSAASPSFNFKAAPNFVYGPHSYKIQELQLPASEAAQFGTISQPLVYLSDLKNFAPHEHNSHEVQTTDEIVHSTPSQTSNHQSHEPNHQTHNSNQPNHYTNHPTHHSNQQSQHTNQQSQHTNQQLHHSNQPQHQSNQPPHQSNQPSHQSNHQTYASTFQRFYDNPSAREITSIIKDTKQQGSQNDRGQIHASPAQTSVTAIVNGKKTVINLETKPPLPLLNLDLLEPLTFDNPVVTQLQHYLPKVNMYHKLPLNNVKKGKHENKEFIITKTKSYDSGKVKGETSSEPKKYNKPQVQKKPSKPGITVKGYPNSGDYSYEINTPNHKETYNEQVIKYNTETNMKPVDFTYNEQSGKAEPEVYTFVHSSKEPLKVTHVEYNSENDGPKHIIYNLSPQDKEEKPTNKVNQPAPEESDEESGEAFSDSEENSPEQNSYHEISSHPHREEQLSHNNPEYTVHVKQKNPPNKYNEQQIIRITPTKEYHHSTSYNSESPKNKPETHYYVKSGAPSKPSNQNFFIIEETPNFQGNKHGPTGTFVYHESPKHKSNSDSRHLKAEHRAKNHNPQPQPLREPKYKIVQSFAEPPTKRPVVVQGFAQPSYQAIVPEYNEDIRILPTHKPHSAPIKVNPSQHIPRGPTQPTFISFNPPNGGVRQGKIISPQQNFHAPIHHENFEQPHIHEKTKQIIIEKHQETPNEDHNNSENDGSNEENNEEDFENAYKNAAYGFPAYEEVTKDIEKDIFDPDSYGKPYYQSDFNIEHSPFQQYQKEHDKFPKFARLSYKDSKDNNQEDYFLDYATHNPESYADKMKSKVEYYKMFKKNRPADHIYGEDKEQKKAKFTIGPSYDFFKQSGPKPKQTKNIYVKYKVEPVKYSFDHNQEAPRDSRAFASRPTYSKYRTHFVEPQLQYGFEPITEPILFAESEMAAVASNNSPESENPGTRKKIYKEKWYMKKTTRTSKPS